MTGRRILAATAALAMMSGAAIAQDGEKAAKARQSLMTLYSHYIGQAGAMAKGAVPYDADQARDAAIALAALASMNHSQMWAEGSGMDAMPGKTEALAVIWEKPAEFAEREQALATATAEFEQVAGTGLDALRAGLGPVGKSCGGCHENFRKPKD